MKVACIKKKHLKHSQKFCVKYTKEFLSYLIRPPCVEPCFRTGTHVTNFTIDGFFAFAFVFCNRFVVNGNTHYFPSPLSTFTRNWALQCNVSLHYHRELVGLMKWKKMPNGLQPESIKQVWFEECNAKDSLWKSERLVEISTSYLIMES